MLLAIPFSATEAQTQRGKASYYSKRLAGRRTASGEALAFGDFTCAHRTYPFGTLLKVRNLDNGREVVVRVNDRGPFVRGRVVDVSYAAAEQLGVIKSGTCNVEVFPVDGLDEEESLSSLLLVDILPQDLYNPSECPWASISTGKISVE